MFGGQRSDLTNLNWLLKIDLARGYKISRMTGGNLLELPSLEGHEMASIGTSIYIFGGFEGGIVQKYSNKFKKCGPMSPWKKLWRSMTESRKAQIATSLDHRIR